MSLSGLCIPLSSGGSGRDLACASGGGLWAAGVPSQVCAGGEGLLDHPGPADPLGRGRVFQGPQLPDPTHKSVATTTELRVQ